MPGTKSISVVIATYNRSHLLADLLCGLAEQTVPAEQFEVIVVDDGSKKPAKPALRALDLPYDIVLIEQENAGAAVARHNGIMRARGDVIVIVDDDMLVSPGFLAEHLDAHRRGGTLVLGHIADDEEIGAKKPIFELFQGRRLSGFMRALGEGRVTPRGLHLCTGNVSFRRAAYFEVGGFDRSLALSEDRELGIRLEKAGARVVFADRARSIHRSDRADLDAWLRRSFGYGLHDASIARKHPDVSIADPWYFLFRVSPASRPLLLFVVAAPFTGPILSRTAIYVSTSLERLGAERAAIAGATLAYGLEYFRGVREEAGSLKKSVADLYAYITTKRRDQGPAAPSTRGS